MTRNKPEWTADKTLPTGKGGSLQRFEAEENGDHLEIETRAWGSGDLTVNGEAVAHVDDDKDGGDAFRDLEHVAEEYEDEKAALDESDADENETSK